MFTVGNEIDIKMFRVTSHRRVLISINNLLNNAQMNAIIENHKNNRSKNRRTKSINHSEIESINEHP